MILFIKRIFLKITSAILIWNHKIQAGFTPNLFK